MITLAIPVYNMEQYLPRCMKTLLNQTCRDFEIVLIDDGSTDGSGEMCDAYAAEHPDFIRTVHQANGGLSSARNAGIDAAKGAYIIFPDPDDWVEPDYVEKLLEYREMYKADLVCTGYYVDTESGCVPAKRDHPPVTLTATEAQKALLLPPQISGFAWNKLYRLDIIRKNGLRFLNDVGITEDLDFVYRYLAFCGEACLAPSARTYHYFQREGAATRSSFSMRMVDSLHAYEKIIDDCQQTIPELAQAARDEICTTAVNLIWKYENAKMEDALTKKILLGYIRGNLPAYLRGSQYGFGRKVQAVLASICPGLYARLKNAVQRN